MKDNKGGFTLIELLVVISIIGILSTIIIGSLSDARIKSRDQRTAQTITQLRNALELFYLDNGYYPSSRNGADWMGVCSEDNSFSNYYYNEDFYNELLPYISGLSLFEECQDIYYYSVGSVSSYYQNVCGLQPFPNLQGYIVSYSMYETIHDRYFFYEDTSNGTKYHCRHYNN